MKFSPTYIAIGISVLLFSCKKQSQDAVNPTDPLDNQSPYLSKIYEFKPAPGQFSNLTDTQSLIGKTGGGLVSLGGFGGYIVFGFDHAIVNQSGRDLAIYGNPIISETTPFSEPGIVCVMQDKNQNGLPDEVWYELAGSAYRSASTLKYYSITYERPTLNTDDIHWTDNQGKEGYILKNQFHTQGYFPTWASQNKITFTGTLLPNTLAISSSDIITNVGFDFGYADNGSSEYQDKGYNSFDIDWAVDANGNTVKLNSIDFIKVYTGQNCNGNPYTPDTSNPKARQIGEISTDFAGAADIHLLTP